MFLKENKQKRAEVLGYWTLEMQTPLVISGMSGEIYWTNKAFQNFIKYSEMELKNKSWIDLTVKDEEFEAAMLMAKKLKQGGADSYSIRKQYIPKNEDPIWCDSNIIRFPPSHEGEFEFFLVCIKPIKEEQKFIIDEVISGVDSIVEKFDGNIKGMEKLHEKIDDIKKQNFSALQTLMLSLGKIMENNIRLSLIVAAIIAIMLIGDELVNAITTFKNLIGF